jgi:hypothetical protein
LNLGLRYEFQDLGPADCSESSVSTHGDHSAGQKQFCASRCGGLADFGKLVARSSYGIYYGPLPLQVNSVAKTQNGVVQNVREFRTGPVYPSVFPRNTGLQNPTPGANIVVFSPDFVNPYIQQVNLELERELLPDLSVSSGWLYTKGTRLRSNEDINLFPPSTRLVEIHDTARGLNGVFSLPGSAVPPSRPTTFFNQIEEFRSDNNSVYHAFFVQANKRYQHGFQFFANYTLSKLINRGAAPGNQLLCCTSENPFAPGDERGWV